MKSVIDLAVCIVMSLSVMFSGNVQTENVQVTEIAVEEESAAQETANSNAQIANPFTACETVQEAIKIAGFEFEAPDSIEGYGSKKIQAIENQLIEIIYFSREDNSAKDKNYSVSKVMRIRKSVGSEDISGDYNSYGQIKTVTVGGLSVTVKGNEATVNTAVWTDGGYSFAVVSEEAISEEKMSEIIQQVK